MEKREIILLPKDSSGNGISGNGMTGNGMSGNGAVVTDMNNLIKDIELEEIKHNIE